MSVNKLLVWLMLLSTPCFAAFGSKTAWDVKTTGSATNGGGFDAGVGSPGTDESAGSGTAITVTLTAATTGTGSPAFTSTTHGPGNFVHIASGTGCTVGWYEINSQSSGTATFDHAMGSNGNTCTGTIGGSITLTTVTSSIVVTGNTIWIKGGTTYTLTTPGINVSSTTGQLYFIGYTTTHGDATSPVASITNSGSSFRTFSTGSGNVTFKNITMTGIGASQVNNAVFATGSVTAINDAFFGYGAVDGTTYTSTNTFIMINCYSDSSNVKFYDNAGTVFIADSYLAGSSGNTVQIGGSGTVINSIFNGTTNTADSIYFNGSNLLLLNNTINGTHNNGVEIASASGHVVIQNNLIYGSTGVGLAVNSAVPAGTVDLINNAYGNNTGGNLLGITAGPNDQILTASPFTSAGTGDFSLNTTAGGGALCRATGFPGVFSGGASTGYIDIGAVQAQCTSGGGAVACGFSYNRPPDIDLYRQPIWRRE